VEFMIKKPEAVVQEVVNKDTNFKLPSLLNGGLLNKNIKDLLLDK